MSNPPISTRPHLLFVVESGTDVRMVNGLAEHFEVSIFARTIPSGREINYKPSFPVKFHRGPQSRMKFALAAARRAFVDMEYDILIVQGYSLAALACNFVARLRGRSSTVMLVCSPIESYYRCRRAAQSGPRYNSFELLCLKIVARLNAWLGYNYVVLSRYLESVIRSHGRTRNIYRIPIYGIDTNLFRPIGDGDKSRVRTLRGVPESGSVIFFSSRTAPEKDVPTLLKAFKMLLDDGEDCWLLHRSGGHKEFAATAEVFGVGERVITADAIYPGAELVEDYQASDLCVQASRAEGLGFSVLEALSCEIPVIAAAVGGLPETVIPGETGWTYVPGDAADLHACIRTVLRDAQEARKRAKAGRVLVGEEYESRRLFEKFANLADELMTAQSGRRYD